MWAGSVLTGQLGPLCPPPPVSWALETLHSKPGGAVGLCDAPPSWLLCELYTVRSSSVTREGDLVLLALPLTGKPLSRGGGGGALGPVWGAFLRAGSVCGLTACCPAQASRPRRRPACTRVLPHGSLGLGHCRPPRGPSPGCCRALSSAGHPGLQPSFLNRWCFPHVCPQFS